VKPQRGLDEPTGVSEYLRDDPSAKQFLHGVKTLPRQPEKILLASGEIRKTRWVYSPTAKAEMAKVEEQEFYARETGMDVDGPAKQLTIKAQPPPLAKSIIFPSRKGDSVIHAGIDG
jgi:hypothetical protein